MGGEGRELDMRCGGDYAHSALKNEGNPMWKLVSVLVFLLAPLLNAQHNVQDAAQPDSEQARILTLENAWNQAVQLRDAFALNTLLSVDLIYVEYDGALMNKAKYMASVKSPAIRPLRIVNDAMSVHLYDKVAVVSGICRETGIKNGKPFALRERFTDTWIRRSNSWVCIASQSTLMPR
jgi:ketosteroid isomerase-like protein